MSIFSKISPKDLLFWGLMIYLVCVYGILIWGRKLPSRHKKLMMVLITLSSIAMAILLWNLEH